MKRILPLLLAVLLLTACGAAPAAEPQQPETTASPRETEPAEAPGDLPETALGPDEDPEEDELPRDEAGQTPAALAPALSDTTVTLDGLNSYLRLTLPEGWTWEQAEGPSEVEMILVYPEDDPAFAVQLCLWNEGFAMCGTGVTTQKYTLPNGTKATLATEEIGGSLSWTLILPQSPDAFTIQFTADTAVYEAHRAELELMLDTLQQGVLAGLDVVVPDSADK